MAKKKPSSADAVKSRARRPGLNRSEQKAVKQTTSKRTLKQPSVKPYDAEKSFGMIPGLAERMADYLRTMRDGR